MKLRTISGTRVMHTKGPGPQPGPFLCARSVVPLAIARFVVSVGPRAGYLTSVTNGGRIVTWPVDREADIEQAQVFHSLLAERRAQLCDRLDEQAVKLARYEHSRDSAGARRKRLRIKEIGAEIRDIDRMMQGLMGRLLGARRSR